MVLAFRGGGPIPRKKALRNTWMAPKLPPLSAVSGILPQVDIYTEHPPLLLLLVCTNFRPSELNLALDIISDDRNGNNCSHFVVPSKHFNVWLWTMIYLLYECEDIHTWDGDSFCLVVAAAASGQTETTARTSTEGERSRGRLDRQKYCGIGWGGEVWGLGDGWGEGVEGWWGEGRWGVRWVRGSYEEWGGVVSPESRYKRQFGSNSLLFTAFKTVYSSTLA